MDIGTTTVYGQLIDLATGKCLAEAGDFNGQISYGEDVISRIIYAEKGDGLEKLHAGGSGHSQQCYQKDYHRRQGRQ
jgi:uncharacterized 2Fe-2S/4Fe-4S cluster protein (DUF4445 family)